MPAWRHAGGSVSGEPGWAAPGVVAGLCCAVLLAVLLWAVTAAVTGGEQRQNEGK